MEPSNRLSSKIIFTMAILVGQTSAVENYYKCLECFKENREDFYYCNPTALCMPASDFDCGESDKVMSYYDCPNVINQEQCTDYTFTRDNFDQVEPIVEANVLNAGEGCWMQIDREPDGSYGTVAIEYDNRYIYIFDEFIPTYESGIELGLLEEATALGWTPRKFFVANGSVMPGTFNAVYQSGIMNATVSTLLLVTSLAFSSLA